MRYISRNKYIQHTVSTRKIFFPALHCCKWQISRYVKIINMYTVYHRIVYRPLPATNYELNSLLRRQPCFHTTSSKLDSRGNPVFHKKNMSNVFASCSRSAKKTWFRSESRHAVTCSCPTENLILIPYHVLIKHNLPSTGTPSTQHKKKLHHFAMASHMGRIQFLLTPSLACAASL